MAKTWNGKEIVYKHYLDKKIKAVWRKCDFCGEKYKAPISDLERDGKKGMFCSQSCSSRYRIESNRSEKENEMRRKEIDWSNDLAYLIGLIASDGSITKDKPEIRFSTTDKELKNNFSDIVSNLLTGKELNYYEHNYRDDKIEYGAKFTHRKFYQFLLNIGIMPNKSHKLAKIKVPNKYFFHFLRGEFEGDGYVSTRRGRLLSGITSGSGSFLKWIDSTIKQLSSISGGGIYEQDTVFELSYYHNDSLTLYRKLYDDSKYYLNRKKKVFGVFIGQ